MARKSNTRIILLVMAAIGCVVGLWLAMEENRKDWQMMDKATDKMNEARERSFGPK